MTCSASTGWVDTVERLLVQFKSLGCPIVLDADSKMSLTIVVLQLCQFESKRTGRPMNPPMLLDRLGCKEIFDFAREADQAFHLVPPHGLVALVASVYSTTLAQSVSAGVPLIVVVDAIRRLNAALLTARDISRFADDDAMQGSLQEIFVAYMDALFSLTESFKIFAGTFLPRSSSGSTSDEIVAADMDGTSFAGTATGIRTPETEDDPSVQEQPRAPRPESNDLAERIHRSRRTFEYVQSLCQASQQSTGVNDLLEGVENCKI